MIRYPDVMQAFLNVCQGDQLYGVIHRLAALSKGLHAAVQPLLRKIKKRIVLDMDDWHFRNKRKDKNIQ
jgi:hypothetical protein